jgi:hypothetical protein
MSPAATLRSGARLFVATAIATLALGMAPAAAQERVTLRGTSVTLTAPAGFTLARDGKGLENAATGSSITIAERPADAYADLAARFSSAKSLSEGYAGQGVTIRSVRAIAAPAGNVPFAVGRQTSQGLSAELAKYLALLKGDKTVLVTFTAADRTFSEADAEAVVRSIELAKEPTVEEQLATLPFTLRVVAPFRVTNVRARSTVTLGVASTPASAAGEPAIVIGRGDASARPGEEPQVAVDLLKNTSGLRDAQIVRAEPSAFAGGDGYVVEATVGERKVTQYLRILPGGSYVRFLARGPAPAMEAQAAAIEEIAGSIDSP